MREIKFKAKHLTENVICEVITLTDEGAFLVGVKKGKYTYYDDGKSIVIAPDNGRFCKINEIELLQFTGFKDKNDNKIFDGNIIGDWQDVDGERVQSKQQVFWNEPTGSWHLDKSFKQDKTCSTDLWLELENFDYKILGNIYENVELLAQT